MDLCRDASTDGMVWRPGSITTCEWLVVHRHKPFLRRLCVLVFLPLWISFFFLFLLPPVVVRWCRRTKRSLEVLRSRSGAKTGKEEAEGKWVVPEPDIRSFPSAMTTGVGGQGGRLEIYESCLGTRVNVTQAEGSVLDSWKIALAWVYISSWR